MSHIIDIRDALSLSALDRVRSGCTRRTREARRWFDRLCQVVRAHRAASMQRGAELREHELAVLRERRLAETLKSLSSASPGSLVS